MDAVERQFKLRRKKIKIIIILTVLYAVFFSLLIIIKPKLIISNLEMVLEVNTEIIKPTMVAKYFGIDITKQIKESGEININELGEYSVTYYVDEGFNYVSETVIYKVVDNTSPEITLNGNSVVNICNKKEYSEEGYTALDNYDGDITDKVTISKNNNIITYSVTDSSGNLTTKERLLTACKKDLKPTISLRGSNSLYIPLNNEYVEYGAIAKDVYGNDLTVSISGSVDNTKVGYYSITYSAEDLDGNKNSVKRNIYVYNPNTSQNLNGKEAGVIYLTFDDGPSSYTIQALNILDKYQIKATFFVTGLGSDDAIKEEYQRGHTVGLHTYTHKWDIYSSIDSYFNDLNTISDRVYNITGQRSMIIRFPGGSSNTVSRKYSTGIMTKLTSEVLDRGYHYFDWNVSVGDAGGCVNQSTNDLKKSCVLKNFKAGLSKSRSNIVLMHDIKKYTIDALDDMIKYAISEGYTFAPITMDTEQIHMRVNN